MLTGVIIAFFIFFILFFITYTTIPLIIFIFLKRILIYDEDIGFWKNFFKLFLVYFVLAIPIAIILYQASTFGEGTLLTKAFGDYVWATLILFIMIILNLIRLSLLLEKRKYINKIKFIHINPVSSKQREWLHREHFSFLFEILFAGFFFGTLILVFKATFLSNFTNLLIPETYQNLVLAQLYNNGWELIKPIIIYLGISLGITFIVEVILKFGGHYKLKLIDNLT